nr:unnamed protein product [Digitaria exilis]
MPAADGVERARPASVQPVPWLPLPAPVQQADGSGVEPPAEATVVVSSEPVLVPPVVHRRDASGEHEQERRQRAQLVDAHPLLELHPLLDPRRVPRPPPPREVEHHHARVEVARAAAGEGRGELRRRPEPRREVGGEVGAAVLRRRHGRLREERRRGEGGDVVGEHDVGVEVDDAADAGREGGGELRGRSSAPRMEVEMSPATRASSANGYTRNASDGNDARTVARSSSAVAVDDGAEDEMKWKKMDSGQEAWRSTESTAAMVPRRYDASSVMATCTAACGEHAASAHDGGRGGGHCAAAEFVKCGASRYLGKAAEDAAAPAAKTSRSSCRAERDILARVCGCGCGCGLVGG